MNFYWKVVANAKFRPDLITNQMAASHLRRRRRRRRMRRMRRRRRRRLLN